MFSILSAVVAVASVLARLGNRATMMLESEPASVNEVTQDCKIEEDCPSFTETTTTTTAPTSIPTTSSITITNVTLEVVSNTSIPDTNTTSCESMPICSSILSTLTTAPPSDTDLLIARAKEQLEAAKR